jgi:hypothetical protein
MSENQLSKSILRVACYEICQKYSNTNYLPVYEKMMDDFRDYRFYKSDLIHPSDLAIELIFKEFSSSIFTKETLNQMYEIEKINLELSHKTMYLKSQTHKKFLEQLLAKLTALNQNFDFSKEIEHVRSQL